MPRIQPMDPKTITSLPIREKVPTTRDGHVLNALATLAHHPPLLDATLQMGKVFAAASEMDDGLRELVVLFVVGHHDCTYEWHYHARSAARAGVTPEQVAWLRADPSSANWTGDERLVLDVAETLVNSGHIDDDLWEQLSQRFCDSQVLELIALVGFYSMVSAVFNNAQVELDAKG